MNRTINNLFRQGAEVYYQSVAMVHVSGHAAQEELKLMLNLLRPTYVMPVHGEYRQLILHAKLAYSLGISEDHIVVAEDGDIVEVTTVCWIVLGAMAICSISNLEGLRGKIGRQHEVGLLRYNKPVYPRHILLRPVRVSGNLRLGLFQVVVILVCPDMRDSEELLESARERVLESFIGLNGHASDWSFVKDKIRHTLSEFLYEKTHRRPMILPVVMEV